MNKHEIKEAKSLRWLAFQFPLVEHPKNEAERMCNAIHVYAIAGAEKIEAFADNKGWVSVEDRLPTNLEPVLCWHEYYHWSKGKVLPEYGIGYCNNGYWGGEVMNGREAKVLYWMPLPQPPEVCDEAGAD